MTSSDTETAEVLNDFFKSTFTTEDPKNIPIIPTRHFVRHHVVRGHSVFRKLLSLNGNEAPVPDNIHPHLLKSCTNSLTKPVFLLAQQSLSSGSLPDIWKNSHPSSLTSQVVNLIEIIIREQLWDFLTH